MRANVTSKRKSEVLAFLTSKSLIYTKYRIFPGVRIVHARNIIEALTGFLSDKTRSARSPYLQRLSYQST
jgi:hypothetical protein